MHSTFPCFFKPFQNLKKAPKTLLKRKSIEFQCFRWCSWRISESNRRPFECHSNALPTALCPHLKFTFSLYRCAINLSREFVRRKIPAFPSFEFDRILCYTFKKKSRKGRKIKLCWNGSGKRKMCGSVYKIPKNRL